MDGFDLRSRDRVGDKPPSDLKDLFREGVLGSLGEKIGRGAEAADGGVAGVDT